MKKYMTLNLKLGNWLEKINNIKNDIIKSKFKIINLRFKRSDFNE